MEAQFIRFYLPLALELFLTVYIVYFSGKLYVTSASISCGYRAILSVLSAVFRGMQLQRKNNSEFSPSFIIKKIRVTVCAPNRVKFFPSKGAEIG